MDISNSTANSVVGAVQMPAKDYFRLPAYMRKVQNGLQVQATVNGKQAFVPVTLH